MSGRIRAFFARPATMLRWSAVLTLVGLALMVWSMIDPTPFPVMLAMTGGQALGTLAFLLYVVVVVQDFRSTRREKPTP